MTPLQLLKQYFRNLIKVVASGPPVGTPGSNRAAGVLSALDALADFAAGNTGVTQAQLDAVATTLPALVSHTAAYTLVLIDAGCQVPVGVAAAADVTIPADDAVAFPVGTILEVSQEGAGVLTMVGGPIAGGGTVLVEGPGNAVKTGGQFAVVGLRKHGPNHWRVRGGVV